MRNDNDWLILSFDPQRDHCVTLYCVARILWCLLVRQKARRTTGLGGAFEIKAFDRKGIHHLGRTSGRDTSTRGERGAAAPLGRLGRLEAAVVLLLWLLSLVRGTAAANPRGVYRRERRGCHACCHHCEKRKKLLVGDTGHHFGGGWIVFCCCYC